MLNTFFQPTQHFLNQGNNVKYILSTNQPLLNQGNNVKYILSTNQPFLNQGNNVKYILSTNQPFLNQGKNVKGTVSVVSSTLVLINPLYLINDDLIACLCLKVFSFDNSYMFSCSRNPQPNHAVENNQFLKFYTLFSFSYLIIRQSFKGWIGYCHLRKEVHLKLHTQSL